MAENLSSSAQKMQDTLKALGYDYQVVEFAEPTRTAIEAAQAVGCEVGQIAKSLVFRTKQAHKPVLVIASGPNRVNEKRIAEYLGEAIERPDADYVREQTGFAIGGIPPMGHLTPLETLIDEDLLTFTDIWAAAGTPRAVFKLDSTELPKMTGGRVVSVK